MHSVIWNFIIAKIFININIISIDIFIVIKDGLNEGEDVILNPLAYIDEAEKEVLVSSGNDPDQKDAPDASVPE